MDQLLTSADVEHALGVSRWTVWRLVKRGELEAAPDGNRVWIKAKSLRALISRSTRHHVQGDAMTSPDAGSRLPVLHSFKEVAPQYGKTVRALKDLVRAKQLDHVHIGIDRYFTDEQLEAFIEAQTKRSPRTAAIAAVSERQQRRRGPRRERPAA